MNPNEIFTFFKSAVEGAYAKRGQSFPTAEEIEADAKAETLPAHIETPEQAAQVHLALLIFWKTYLPPEIYRAQVELAMMTNLSSMMIEVEKEMEYAETATKSTGRKDGSQSID